MFDRSTARAAAGALATLALACLGVACEPPPVEPPVTVVDGNYNPVDREAVDAARSDAIGDAARPDTRVDAAIDAARDAAVDAARPDTWHSDTWRPDAGRDAATGQDATTGHDAATGPDAATGHDAGVTCGDTIFTLNRPSATSVVVAGSFNGWGATPQAGGYAMANDGSGNWSATRPLAAGAWQYKFVVDGSSWIYDPGQPSIDDGHGNVNNVVYVWGCAESCPAAFDWRDSVMYFAMVDRFYNSDNHADPVDGGSGAPSGYTAANGPSGQYEGGDLPGVTAKIPYLADLGVTALWISAPYDNRNAASPSINPGSDSHQYSAYHGYWPSPVNTSYANMQNPTPRPLIESRIGDEQDLRDLVSAAHGATSANGDGVKVLFDYVMNHADIDSPLYQNNNGWFVPPWNGTPPANGATMGQLVLCQPGNLWDDAYWGTRCAFASYLPDFNYDLDPSRAWSVADAVWWATEFGIDGYRLDAIKHVPMQWLLDLRSRFNRDISNSAGGRFYLVGETFNYFSADALKAFVDPATKLDGQFDFPFKRNLCEAVFTTAGRLDSFASWSASNDGYYGSGAIMTTWIGNHDVPRAIHFANRQIGNCTEGSYTANSWDPASYQQPADAAAYERLAVAFAIMMTSSGIPLIYYGDEVGLAGGGDPDNRRLMPWNDANLSNAQQALRSKVRSLARIRGSHPALGRGFRQTVSADQDTWVYRVGGCGEDQVVTVAINRSDASRSVTVPAGSYTDLINGGDVNGGSVSLGARSFVVLGPR